MLNTPPLVFVLKILLTFVIPYTILESLSIWSMGQMLHSCLVITSQLQIPLSFLTENFNAILTLLITIALGNPRPRALSKFVHRNGNDNPDDIVTNSCASNTWFPLMKPLIFWSDMDFIKERVVPREVKTCRQYRLYLKLRALHSSPSRFILGIF